MNADRSGDKREQLNVDGNDDVGPPTVCPAIVAVAVAVATGDMCVRPVGNGNDDEDDVPEEPECTENLVPAVDGQPPKRNNAASQTCNPVTIDSSYIVQVSYLDDNVGRGLRTGMIALFVAGEMAGVGMLTAPWAVANMGWMGFVLLLAIGIAVAHSGKCLGTCWMILEERFFECRQYPIVDQYATIAKHAIGYKASIFTKFCVHSTLFGAATVYLMLIAQSAQKLFMDIYPEINFCTWLFMFSILLGALMFIASPKDVRLVAGSVLLSTMAACYIIIVQILHNLKTNDGRTATPQKEWDINQLLLSFSTLVFSFGGTIAFPAIQNNMFKRNEYSRSVLVSFMILSILFGAVIVGGYVVYGEQIQSNILMSLEDSAFSHAAVLLMMTHLILGFLIIINPVSQNLDTFFGHTNGSKFECFVVRVFLMTLMTVIGTAIQDFGNLIVLMGSSSVALGIIVMPQIFYMQLCSKIDCTWPDRTLSWKSKICPCMIIAVGLTLSVFSSYAAIERIVDADTVIKPCYLPGIYPTN